MALPAVCGTVTVLYSKTEESKAPDLKKSRLACLKRHQLEFVPDPKASRGMQSTACVAVETQRGAHAGLHAQ